MRLSSVDLDVKTIGREIEHFLSATSRGYWEKLIKKVDTSCGIFYKEYLLRKNPFTEGFRQYFHLYSEGKSIWKNRTAEIDYLAQKIFIINKIIRNVNDRGQAQIIGRLRGGDIRSFLQEITIATHFLRNGFEVNFIEYERPEAEGRTFDFLVSRDSIEAEVECKSKSYDAGRKIKRDGFYILCDELFRQFKSTRIKCFLEINCSENLGQNHDIFMGIVKRIKSAIKNGDKKILFSEDFSIAIYYLPPETLIDSDEKFTAVIQPYWTPKSHFATVSNNEMTMIVKVESEEKDRVLKAMYDELKSSLGQFSETRPAIVACYIEGIYPEQWEDLKGENGLAAMTTYLLKREKAEHIHTIGYSSEVEIIRTGNIMEYRNPVLFFKNENCNYYKGQDIFSFKTDNYKQPLP